MFRNLVTTQDHARMGLAPSHVIFSNYLLQKHKTAYVNKLLTIILMLFHDPLARNHLPINIHRVLQTILNRVDASCASYVPVTVYHPPH